MAVTERKIIQIDENKCNGCGICVDACHEGAIQMVDGKARLVSDIYCDGLGDCLGPCPTGAISIITRQAEAYDEEAVAQRMASVQNATAPSGHACPGSAARELKPKSPAGDLPCGCPGSMSRSLKESAACSCDTEHSQSTLESELMNWPVQLKLVPPGAPYLKSANILMAADCTAFAVPDFHSRFLQNKPVIISCPKLEDNAPQIAKMTEIIRTAKPTSITIVRMEVPCCGGLVRNVEEAINRSGIDVPMRTIIVSVDGTEYKC